MKSKYKVVSGVIEQDGIEIIYLKRVELENTMFNIEPCRKDAMTHFLVDNLNNGNFEAYFKKYMQS